MQQLTREQIISVCQTEPETFTEAYLALKTEVAELRAELQAVKDRLAQDSHNSHQPPSRDRVPRPRPKSLRQASHKKAGGQVGHAGTTLQPVDKPDQIIVHKVERCQNCQQSLKAVAAQNYDKRQVFEVPPLRLKVTEHQDERKECPHCQQITGAAFPEGLTHVTQYGEGVKALSAYLNTYQLLPCERTAEFFQDVFSQGLSAGSVVNFNHECFTGLVDYDQAVKAKITAARKRISTKRAPRSMANCTGCMWPRRQNSPLTPAMRSVVKRRWMRLAFYPTLKGRPFMIIGPPINIMLANMRCVMRLICAN